GGPPSRRGSRRCRRRRRAGPRRHGYGSRNVSFVRDSGDTGVEIVRGWVPGGRVGGDLLARADVLDLVGAGVGTAGEPDVGDAAPLGVADLPAVLGGRGRPRGGSAPP